MPDSRAPAGQPPERRSPCPLACGLDVFGDRWTLLVVRDLLFGDKRFKDFTAAPERIPTNLLSDRLARLTAHGIVEQVPAPPGGSRHLAYRLTVKGRALGPSLAAMRDWALAWVPGTEAHIMSAQAKITGKITPSPSASSQTAGAGVPTGRRRRSSRAA